jgi:hypothetical protein
LVDQFLDAIVARDPSRLPLATACKFTENGQRLEPGDGLWNTASARGPYSLYFADMQAGQVGLFCTVQENGTPAMLALRLKVEGAKIAEIETLVARDPSGAQELEKLGSPHPTLLEDTPPAARVSRAELVRISDLYFSGLERNDGHGVYPFTDDCIRVENGKPTTSNPAAPPDSGSADASGNPPPFNWKAWGSRTQFDLGFFRFVTRIRDRRYVVIDQERGLVLGFAFLDHAGNVPTVTLTNGITIPIGITRPWTWEVAELFKVEGGLIRRIEVVLTEAPYGMNSGWSTYKETMSSRARWQVRSK